MHTNKSLEHRRDTAVAKAIAYSATFVADKAENAEVWETAALFRYKSRRAFLEIVTHPDMNSKHKYKIAALEKTIAFPVEAQLYLGDPRLLLGFIFSILGLLLRPITRR